jgi:hypothetical protein
MHSLGSPRDGRTGRADSFDMLLWKLWHLQVAAIVDPLPDQATLSAST